MSELYFDIETLDWIPPDRDLSKIRFGIAVTHDTHAHANGHRRTWLTWGPSQAADLARHILYTDAEKIVGWNIVDFDLRVLEHNTGWEMGMIRGRVFDLMREIRNDTDRWYKLDVIAAANLERSKIGHGDLAVQWLNSGDRRQIAQAVKYCRDDVELVIQLYKKIQRGEPLLLPARPSRREWNDYLWLPGKVEYAVEERKR
jgi:hypothetical protein